MHIGSRDGKSVTENRVVQTYGCNNSINWKMKYGYFLNLEIYRTYLKGEKENTSGAR